MQSLINANFNRTYNPSNGQNALSDIKRLLASRDTVVQNKACGYISEVINRYDENTSERNHLVQYLLSNDITVFLCEAMSNLDWSLYRNIVKCLRLLSSCRVFFEDEHDAHASAALTRALVYYTGSGNHGAIDFSLHFLCELLSGIREYNLTSPLSYDSAYSTEQLLACLNSIALKSGRSTRNLTSALVLQAILSYQPVNLRIRGPIALALTTTCLQWFPLLMGVLNQTYLTDGDIDVLKMYYVVVCQLGMDVIRLSNIIRESKTPTDFVQTIINDEQEVDNLAQSSATLDKCIHTVIHDLVNFTKENYKQLPNEEYGVFLTFLHTYLKESKVPKALTEFSDFLFVNNYLSFLPQAHIERCDLTIKKVSTLVLGEMLESLSIKYLVNNSEDDGNEYCVKDIIQMGLVELQYGIEKPQHMGEQLQKCQSYAPVIFLYFYCQSSQNPHDTMANFLSDLVQHILYLPKTFSPPKYVVKCLWLVFAMCTVANSSLKSLSERLHLEKAIEKFVKLLQGRVSDYYTHNPAILLWGFISHRIPLNFRITIVSLWLEVEDSLPTELASHSMLWEVLLYILKQNVKDNIVENAAKAFKACVEDVNDDTRQQMALMLWNTLPDMLSQVLIDFNKETNARYILDLATNVIPSDVDSSICLKIAVLLTSIYSKSPVISEHMNEERLHYIYSCLKLCLYLLGLAKVQEDNRVLLTYVNRTKFLGSILQATYSFDDKIACVALQLLSCIIHYYNGHTRPKTLLQVETSSILSCLKTNSSRERSSALLQFVFMILSSGAGSPLALSSSTIESSDENLCYSALRGLMFRIQMMCCKDSNENSSSGWKTLSAIFTYGIITIVDTKLVTILTTQPWTHTLIQFQLSQNVSEDFLNFTYSWLTFLKIVLEKQPNLKTKQMMIHRPSLTYRTLMLLQNKLIITEEDEKKSIKLDILSVVQTILNNDSRSGLAVNNMCLPIEYKHIKIKEINN